MFTLILETSGDAGHLILAHHEEPVAYRQLPGGPELSKTLAKEVKDLLAGQVPNFIAVGLGPGSYTGIRVGLSLAKGLSYGWQIPLVGFNSLEIYGVSPLIVDAKTPGFYTLIEGRSALLPPDSPLILGLHTLFSPHPEKIQKRLHKDVLRAEIDLKYLIENVLEKIRSSSEETLQPLYLSIP